MRNKSRTIHVILNTLGALCLILGCCLIIPIFFIIFNGEMENGHDTLVAFCVTAGLSFFLAGLLKLLFRQGNPNRLQAMLICSLGWLIFSAIGALPYVIVIRAGYLEAFFEAMSGFTTTGITMFTGLDCMPMSVLFWRSFTQWIGGLGILTFFLAVIYRGGSAHMLFGAESHKTGIVERPVPGLANTLKILWAIYSGFTVFIALCLMLTGMSFFDSLCHSFTALSTGGFSPHDASIAYYHMAGYAHYAWIEYILIVGMLMGGINFLIHYRVLTGGWRALFDNTEMRHWWFFVTFFVIIILGERLIKIVPLATMVKSPFVWTGIENSVRTVIFQVVAILTTTGFSTKDIASPYFGHVARQLFLVMMVIGGCVGSTGGGLKVLRVSVLFKLLRREVYKVRAPARAVSSVLVDGEPIDRDEVYRVAGLFFAWIFLLVLGGVTTAFFSNLGAYESFSGMFSALGNIGPCYISVASIGKLGAAVKVIYMAGMLAGRLEILPVMLLFSRAAWRS